MGNKTDLRVIKTVRAIKEAFMKLIVNKPINKISVAELAKEAEINKGTFYLHYPDIYKLYDDLVVEVSLQVAGKFNPYPDLFVSPEAFVQTFLFSETEPPSKVELAILKEGNLKFSTSYPNCFIDAFRSKIYEVGKLTPSKENDIKIEFIINGMFSILIRPGLVDKSNPQCIAFIINYLSEIIQHTFPEFYLSPVPSSHE